MTLESPNPTAAAVLDDLERDCERLVTIEHEREISSGPAASAITRAAEIHDADEIVIGSRGVGRVRALLGSVAHDVIHRAHCPVIEIPERMVEIQTAPPATVPAARDQRSETLGGSDARLARHSRPRRHDAQCRAA